MNRTPQPVTLDTGTSIMPGAVYNGKRIKPFTKKDVFSKSRINELVAVLNCFLNPQLRRGNSDQIVLSDGGWIEQINNIAGGGGTTTGGMNYRGLYSHTATYNYGDVVRWRTGASQGVWVCVTPIGSPVSGVDPVFPEPADSGGTNTWELLSFGVYQYQACVAGVNKTFYIQMLEQ